MEAPVVGFANHTNREAMDAALAAGADQVLARSAFFARLDDLLFGVYQVGSAFALSADLHDALVFPGRFENRLPLEDIAADGFLQVDIRARLDRGDGV